MRVRVFAAMLLVLPLAPILQGCAAGSASRYVVITPQQGSVQAGEQLQFSADVRGLDDTSVTWSTNAGVITATGLYTAPHVPGAYQITVQSAVDAKVKQTVTVKVTQAPLTAVRTFSAPKYTPGSPLTVTLTVVPGAAVGFYAIEEAYPPRWTISSVSDGGAVDLANGKVKWFFVDNLTRTLTFVATPPSDETEPRTFTGTLVVDADAPITVIGSSSIGR